MIYIDISYNFSKFLGKEEAMNSFSVINQMGGVLATYRENAFRKANDQGNLEKVAFDKM